MLEEKKFFNLDNWRKFKRYQVSEVIDNSKILDEITSQNKKGFIVITEQNGKYIDFFKKHATSILKSIIIGKFTLIDFSDFKKSVDSFKNQSNLIKDQFSKQSFSKFSVQKQMYFPED